jgi:hypothetical protein
MITPSFGLTATERVLPRLALDWTTGIAQTGVDVTRAGVATFVGSNGFIQSASVDTQRIDYSTGVAGLLVEESRTNSCLQSQNFSTIWGNGTRLLVTTDATTSPANDNTADKIIGTTNTDQKFLEQTIAVTTGTTYTLSLFAKKDEYEILQMSAANTQFSGTLAYANYNLTTGVVVSSADFSASIEDYGNGWYRCVLVTTAATGTGNNPFRLSVYASGDPARLLSYTGDGESGLFMWGAQLEAGAFPTSYIPTTTTAVTRNADVATMTGTNFSDWYNPTEGTFSIDCIINTKPAAQILMEMSDGTSANRFQYQRDSSSNTLSYLSIVSSSITVNLAKTSTFVNDVASITSAYKLDNYGIAVNGGVTTTDTSSGVPVVDRMRICATVAGAAPSSGWYQKLLYYPQRLTNAEIQAFSK